MIHWPQTETHTRKYIHWIDCVWECIANTAPPTIITLTLLLTIHTGNSTLYELLHPIIAISADHRYIFTWYFTESPRVRRLFFGSGFSISFYNVHSSRTSPLLLTWFNLVIQFPWHVLSRHWLDVARVYCILYTLISSHSEIKKNGSQRK